MAGPEDFLPPSFWAASISCLFLSSSSICFFLAWASASFLSCSSLFLSGEHLLPFPLILLHLLLLGLGLCFLLVLLLLLDLLLLCSLLCCLLLLLLGTDLLPGGLFVFQPLQLSLLLGALVPPLGDVLPQLVVHLGLLLEVFGRRHGDE